ncbi:S1C family serine protease [Paenibacillus arenilitoris]|uniref:Trypsin-like peptidase domain-containing protein n=1 Tax=Paenibacillus arenilitoris TaxID=2772299 RepID=A0A927CQ24_9BACL|nr:trypsin-like peptidase domain-containing protein [Paenibacillus arenilitoris]MBD2872113.1 trypsin-like peptidase domain-containing protein [Paenibacillus arenilitoris]
MDDQDNKKGYDDFFRKPDDRQDDGGSGTGERYSQQEDGEEQAAKPSYYYSYGPFRPSARDDERSSGHPGGAGPQDKPKIIQDLPYGTTGSVRPSYAQETEAESRLSSVTEEEQAQARKQSPVRSFNPQTAKGSWQVREPRRTSFKAIFSSFLAGVVLVGALMYTADLQNWFTGAEQTTAGESESSGSGSAGSSTAGSGSTAAAVAARPDNISQLFETASPAVVKIETYVNTAKRNSGGSSLLDDPFFRQFFGEDYPGTTQPESNEDGQMQQSGIGTGFFFESTGYILTNQHVVGDSDQIKVIVQGYDKPFTAELLGSSYELDLAVIKITGDQAFPTLPLGSSDDIEIGDWVVAIGNPYGFDHTVTVGVLSAKERPIDIQDAQGERNYEHLLQTDASINPGNSGGPLLNVNGEVIGINTAVSSQAQGIGFAIPTSTINEVLDNLKNNKEIPKPAAPFIGAELQDVTEEIAKQLGMEKVEGSIVRNVYYNSPAYMAGLQQFDVITGIDGKKYGNTQALIDAIQAKKVGDKAKLNVVRKGTAMDLEVEIGDKNTFNAAG